MSFAKVLPFSAENIRGALSNANATPEEVASHGPATYLHQYFALRQAVQEVAFFSSRPDRRGFP
jgi:hypothetical protein